MLRIRGATVCRGSSRKPILDHLTLEIAPGENTAILGPNGSGKSTLIRVITQDFYPVAHPSGGPVVEIFGRARWEVAELRALLGVITPDIDRQFTEGARGRSLRGLDAALSGFFSSRGVHTHHAVTSEMLHRACAELAMMEASHLADKLLPEMSTGEVRRVLIARALVADPPALLLDEPTSGLDVVASQRFLHTLRRLIGRGKTMIIVTHHPYEIIPEVSRVVLLRNGRIFRDGPKDDVLTTDNLSAVFGTEVRVRKTSDGYFGVELA